MLRRVLHPGRVEGGVTKSMIFLLCSMVGPSAIGRRPSGRSGDC